MGWRLRRRGSPGSPEFRQVSLEAPRASGQAAAGVAPPGRYGHDRPAPPAGMTPVQAVKSGPPPAITKLIQSGLKHRPFLPPGPPQFPRSTSWR
jgi:hypothetical protein